MKLGEFNVIYRERTDREYAVYICRKSLSSRLYRIIELTDRNKIVECIKYFDSLQFKDFYGDFSINEKYYIAFSQPDGKVLKAADTEKIPAKSIVKALAMQNPPLELSLPMLSFDNIYVSGNEIRFAYVPPVLDKRVSKDMLEQKLADMVDALWSENRSEEAEQWLISLRSGKFAHLISAFKNMPESEIGTSELKPRNYDKIKNVLLKTAAIIGAVIGIIIMFKLLTEKSEDDMEYDQIDSLGVVDLIDN